MFHAMSVFTMLVCMSPVFAQSKLKFSIDSFENDQFDLSSINEEFIKYDGNGDKYAILKVTSSNPDDNLREYNFNFGNMNHIVDGNDHDGELWVYVQKNAKIVSITRNGYAPMNRFALPLTIESGKVYRMNLTSEGKKVHTQWVKFKVNPSGCNAIVHIKSSRPDAEEQLLGVTDANGELAKNLVYGSYTYKITAENYHLAEGRFTLDDKNVTLTEDVTLKPSFSNITLSVEPGVEIYINGEKMSTGTWKGILNEGNYQVECKRLNHRPTSQYISVTENHDETIQLKNPDPILGTASLSSTPLGASISIDGVPYGETPKNIDIIIGSHSAEFSKPGYQSEVRNFTVVENKTVDVDVNLGRTTTTEIKCTPSFASISIDGKAEAVGNYKYVGDVGVHNVTLSASGYKTLKRKVNFGDNPELLFSLQKMMVKSNDFYIQAGFAAGSMMGVAADIGAHIANFNIEVDYSYCFGKSPDIYWNYTGSGDKDVMPEKCTYSPSLVIGGKIGYGFIVGTRFKFTPQVGMRLTKLREDGEAQHIESANCLSAGLAFRAYCAITPNFGVALTPEYLMAASKSEGFKALSDLTGKIKNWGEGFDVKLSAVLTF